MNRQPPPPPSSHTDLLNLSNRDLDELIGYNNLRSLLSDVVSQLRTQNARITHLEQVHANMTSTTTEMRSSLDALSHVVSRLDGHDADIREVNQRLHTLDLAIQRQQHEYEALQAHQQQDTHAIAAVANIVKEHTSDIASRALSSDVTSLQHTVNAHSSQLVELECNRERVLKLLQTLTDMERMYAAIQKDISRCTTSVDKMEGKMKQQEKILHTHGDLLTRLDSHLNSHIKHMSTLDPTSITSQLSSLQQQVRDKLNNNDIHHKIDDKLADHTQQLHELHAHMKQWNELLGTIRQQIHHLQTNTQQQQSTIISHIPTRDHDDERTQLHADSLVALERVVMEHATRLKNIQSQIDRMKQDIDKHHHDLKQQDLNMTNSLHDMGSRIDGLDASLSHAMKQELRRFEQDLRQAMRGMTSHGQNQLMHSSEVLTVNPPVAEHVHTHVHHHTGGGKTVSAEGNTAIGKIHYRCLTCDQVKPNMPGAKSYRHVQAKKGIRNVSVDGNVYLHGTDGTIYRGRAPLGDNTTEPLITTVPDPIATLHSPKHVHRPLSADPYSRTRSHIEHANGRLSGSYFDYV